MATTRTQTYRNQRTQQSDEDRKGKLSLYLGEKGYEVRGQSHKGDNVYLIFPTLAEFKSALFDRFVGNVDKSGAPAGWRTYSTRFGIETVIDGTIKRVSKKSGEVLKPWEVTLTSNCALAVLGGYDNRPQATKPQSADVLDSEEEEEEESDII